MSASNNDFSEHIRFLKSRTEASYHANNSTRGETDEGRRQSRSLGQIRYTIQPPTNPKYTINPCCPCGTVGSIADLAVTGLESPESPYDLSYNIRFPISWSPVENASYYTIEISYGGPTTYRLTGPTSAYVYVYFSGDLSAYVTLVAHNDCGETTQSTVEAAPCFLAGSMVSMADGSLKAIEEVAVGDSVVGAFGEINTVLALHRPLLGKNRMCKINSEHVTSAHHPHISVNKKFYCSYPSVVENNTYGRVHPVIDGEGNTVEMMLHGLAPGRVAVLEVGVELKTIEGSRIVEDIDIFNMDPATQLYNLVVGGSHTYHVEGYAVTGWPREDDFDYDGWTQK
jgi:hypothetical protein